MKRCESDRTSTRTHLELQVARHTHTPHTHITHVTHHTHTLRHTKGEMSDQQRGGAHRVKPTEPGVGATMCHSGISLVQIDENWSDFNSGDKKTPTFRFRQFFASNGHVVVSF